jgi:hypothetical protein
MRNAGKILSIISERGKNQKPLERIYRLLYNPQLYLMAYQNIYVNNAQFGGIKLARSKDAVIIAAPKRVLYV